MSSSNKPLSSLSLNLVRQKKAKSKKRLEKTGGGGASETQPTSNIPHVRQPYVPLGPRIEHVGQSLLPFPNSEATELKIFELFWDQVVVSVVVEGTNAYAEAKGAGKRTHDGVAFQRPWKKVTDAEIRVFFALLIYMGAQRGSGSNSFWKEKRENTAFV